MPTASSRSLRKAGPKPSAKADRRCRTAPRQYDGAGNDGADGEGSCGRRWLRRGGRRSRLDHSRCGCRDDWLTGRRHEPPLRTERGHTLTCGHAGTGVLREVVQRVARVGDLRRSVGAHRRAEQAGRRSTTRGRGRRADQWRPERRALSGTCRSRRRVGGEQVHRSSRAVSEVAADLAGRGLERHRGCGRCGRTARRRGKRNSKPPRRPTLTAELKAAELDAGGRADVMAKVGAARGAAVPGGRARLRSSYTP